MQACSAPIFVVGTPRSGTTLAANILGRHSNVYMPGENHFFEDIYARRKELGDLSEKHVRELVVKRLLSIYGRYNQGADQDRVNDVFREEEVMNTLVAVADDYQKLLSMFMEVQMTKAGKIRWGNNTPKDIFHIKEIRKFYPNAKVIACVRDLRDFMLSYKNRWKVTTPGHRKRLMNLYHPVITALLWKATVNRVSSLVEGGNGDGCLVVFYEQLVADPTTVVKQICEFVNEPFEQGMLAVDTHNSSAKKRSKGIFSTSVGRWRDNLECEDVLVGQWVAGRVLERCGYQIERVKCNPWKVTTVLLNTPFALVRAFSVNKEKRGPLGQYLNKRIRSLFGVN